MLSSTLIVLASLLQTTPPTYPTLPAAVVRVIDGDTPVLRISLDYDVSTTQAIRMEGFNAPEMGGPNRGAALLVRARLEQLLASGPVWVKRTGPRSFSRYVGRVYVSSGGVLIDLSDQLRREGYDVIQGQ
jgi:endonuclease YncB( thermonuclease family)